LYHQLHQDWIKKQHFMNLLCLLIIRQEIALKYIYIYRGGKQWQTTPKNLPRMQRTRAIPVAWLSSGLCPNRPKGWIPIIIIIYICSKITLIFHAWYWRGTGAELPNILGHQVAHILTLVLKSNFLLLLLYLGCGTNQRSIPLGYFHLLGQGQHPCLCFMGS